jgi:enoyl-CoA hydratase
VTRGREVEVEQAGAVRWLLLNRPQRLNAIDDQLLSALDHEITAAVQDTGTDVLVLAGRGRSFCAGADLRHLLDVAERHGDPTPFLSEVSACVTRLEHCPKPVVAALHGHVVAGGLELALACDLVVAAEGTLIGDGHLRNRLLPAAGSSVRLVRKVGVGLGRRLLLSGELLPVEHFVASGWIQAVVAPESLRVHAEEFARALASAAGPAQRNLKRLLGELEDLSPTEGLAAELGAFAANWPQADVGAALTAFLTEERHAAL